MFNLDQLDDAPITDTAVSFEGGMFSDAQPRRIGANQVQQLYNFDIAVSGEVTTRRGTKRLGAGYVEAAGAFAGGRYIQGMHYFNRTIYSSNTLVAINNRVLWSFDGTIWTHKPGYGAGALPAHTQIPVSIVQGGDKLYLSDIYSNISSFNGTVFASLGSGGATQPPFGCASLAWHTNRLVASASSSFPETLAFSNILDPTTWSTATQEIEIGSGDGEPITGIFSWTDFNLIVFKKRSIWIVNADPTKPVSDFVVKPVTRGIGVTAWRSAAQVGADVMLLTDECKVRSIRHTIATETKQDVGQAISEPIDNILRRINRSYLSRAHAVSWNHRYILQIPVDYSTFPNYTLVFNTLTQSWSGYWTGWDATFMTPYVATDNSTRLAFGDSNGRAKEFLDYVRLVDEVRATYQDDGVDLAANLVTRAMIFGDGQSPKTGFNYEVEYTANMFSAVAAPTVESIDDALVYSSPRTLDTLDGNLRRQAFDLQARGQFREMQFRLASAGGKLSIKRIAAHAFEDTFVVQT